MQANHAMEKRIELSWIELNDSEMELNVARDTESVLLEAR